MIVVVDYGMGNLRSVHKGLEKAGCRAEVSDDPKVIARADAIVLPGVGAFKDCYEGLRTRGLVPLLVDVAQSGRPFLGICVGRQLLFDESEEGEGSRGLAILPGKVVRFPDAKQTGLKVPHMGWNQIKPAKDATCPLLKGPGPNPFVYFVHSYYAKPAQEDLVLATAEYGVEFPAMIGRDNVFATQFHPEKSQREGIKILKAFGDLVPDKGLQPRARQGVTTPCPSES